MTKNFTPPLSYCKSNLFKIIISTIIVIGGLASCSYGDDIDAINDRVDAIESSLNQLQKAYAEGKIISDVKAVEATSGANGYQIHFSDGTSLTLNHGVDGGNGLDGVDGEAGQDGNDGQDGVTPMIRIDSEGYWTVSYDEGATYNRITDPSGKPVSAIGQKGEPGVSQPGINGVDGANGADGKDGVDGKDGQCVRVTLSPEGYYVFETYYPSAPETVLDRIVTPYKSNKNSTISSIVKNEHTGVITLTMEDGVSFDFNLDVAYPTGIVMLNEALVVNWTNAGTITFRLNPSDAFINFVTDGDNANIFLDVVSAYAGRSADETNYVNGATGFRISEVKECVNSEGKVMRGQYSATVVSNNNGENGDERVCLVVKTKNSKGADIYLSSLPFIAQSGSGSEIAAMSIGDVEAIKEGNTFLFKMPATANLKSLKPVITSSCTSLRIKGSEKAYSADDAVNFSNPVTFVSTGPDGTEQEYTAVVHFSNLPVVYMTTPSAITSKNIWTADCEMQIWNAGENDGLYQKVNVKGRGNSTWGLPKKPYAIKLDKKADVLGMPKHKRWVLLANYYDITNLRTETSMDLGRRTGLEYTPRTKFVELVMNGTYQGLYQLTEQLKIDENRVNVGDDGFLLEIDARAGQDPEDVYFRDNGMKRDIVIKDPDVAYGSEDFEYIKAYIASVSSSIVELGNDNNTQDYQNLIDVPSFVDWYLVNELTRNADATALFSSCYMNLKRGEKLRMGPLWDFDLAIGNYVLTGGEVYNSPKGFSLRSTSWYGYLHKSPSFVSKLKSRFDALYNSREDIYANIRTQRDYIREAYIGNELKWHRLNVGTDSDVISQNFDTKVDGIIDWLETRFNWMKGEFDKL